MNTRIKSLRKALKLNQSDFGNRIGIKQATVAGYENGTRQPLDTVISSICREFNVNEEWLRNGTGEMFKPNAMAEIDEIIEKHGLDENCRSFFYAFVGLSAEERRAVIKYCESVADMLKKGEAPAAGGVALPAARLEDLPAAGGAFLPAAGLDGPPAEASGLPGVPLPVEERLLPVDPERISVEEAEEIYKRSLSGAQGKEASALNTMTESAGRVG